MADENCTKMLPYYCFLESPTMPSSGGRKGRELKKK